jgi:hypothetical protein
MKIILDPPIIQAIPLSPDDSLYVEAIVIANPGVILIQGSAINLDGKVVNFSEELNVNLTSTIISKRIPLGYKFLLSVIIFDRDNTLLLGDMLVSCSLSNPKFGIAPIFRKLLCQGYVSTIEKIGYGSGQSLPASFNKQFYNVINIGNPAAITDFSFSCPAYLRADVIGLRFTLQTSAVAGNRQVGIQTINQDSLNIFCFTSRAQAASLIYTYSFNKFQTNDLQVGTLISSSLPDFKLRRDHSVGSFVQGFQAGDQLSNIYLYLYQHTTPSNT